MLSSKTRTFFVRGVIINAVSQEEAMKLKAAMTDGMPGVIVEAMSSREFASSFLEQVVGEALGVEKPHLRPAEFYVQKPDFTINCGEFGVELRLTGVSREGRKAKQFHDALKALHELARNALQQAVNVKGLQYKVQLFCVMMLNGDVETSPGSGVYSNVLEHPAEWVESTSEDTSG